MDCLRLRTHSTRSLFTGLKDFSGVAIMRTVLELLLLIFVVTK